MAGFVEKLRNASRASNSLVCVGLDVDPATMPSVILRKMDPVLSFNKAIIDATADVVCAYKPNLAFYEALGPVGWEILAETVKHIPQDKVVIADGKRGDIGNTAKAYARAVFEVYGFDAVTVNPYLGQDSVQPFIDYQDKGVLVLCKTSNPGSREFQDLAVATGIQSDRQQPLYEIVAQQVVKWNTHGNCGLVVGATYPDELARVRALAPDVPLLIPGVGAQAGDLEAAVRNGTDANKELAIINASRAIVNASSGDDFALAARRAAIKLRDAINKARA